MTPEQTVAFVNTQAVAALIELEAMKMANIQRARANHSPMYGEDEFLHVIDRYGLHQNAVLKLFHDAEG